MNMMQQPFMGGGMMNGPGAGYSPGAYQTMGPPMMPFNQPMGGPTQMGPPMPGFGPPVFAQPYDMGPVPQQNFMSNSGPQNMDPIFLPQFDVPPGGIPSMMGGGGGMMMPSMQPQQQQFGYPPFGAQPPPPPMMGMYQPPMDSGFGMGMPPPFSQPQMFGQQAGNFGSPRYF